MHNNIISKKKYSSNAKKYFQKNNIVQTQKNIIPKKDYNSKMIFKGNVNKNNQNDECIQVKKVIVHLEIEL